MPDIAAIGAVLGSIKTATDIAKFLRTADASIQTAELKVKLAELLVSLADAKMEFLEVQETLIAKEKKITELEDAFQNKDLLVRRYDAYYSAAADGNPSGVPYCLRCWESDHKKRQLVHSTKDRFMRACTACGHTYQTRLAAEI